MHTNEKATITPKRAATPSPCTPNASSGRSGCSVETALGVIGGRWKGVLLYWLLEGTKRYGELRRIVPRCSARILTLQLRELEHDRLVLRTVFAEVPPHVEYTLTTFGRTLEPILLGLREWGDRWERKLPSDAVMASRR